MSEEKKVTEAEELLPCRVCHEDCACIEHEGGWCTYVMCANCGSATAFIAYKNEEERIEAEKKAIHIWNMGKVIAESRGE
ncbi:MAG: Lar family restriction alleviation protein [Lachnospiraceae bacterium]|nr:Lar family restriction alleviation protein [Lachnospiraceae bacterium]